MTGKKLFTILGVLSAIIAAPALFYAGRKLASSSAGSSRVTIAAPSGTAAGDTVHEAMYLAEALKKKPDHTPVLLRMAQLSEESGKPTEAADHLREIIRNEPDNTDARLELGRVLFQTGDVAGAIGETEAILKHHPDHADALYNLGAIYGNVGNAQRAREYWGRLIAAKPESESARRAQGMLAQLPPNVTPVK